MRLALEYPTIKSPYQTPETKPGWFDRSFPTLSFYRSAVAVVFSAASLAKKGKYGDVQWCTSSYRILKALERIGGRVTVDGLQHLEGLEGPCVVVGNHMSTLETFVLPYLIAPYRPMTFVVKQSLVEYPVFKHVMRSRDPIVVGRENPREDLRAMMEGGLARLQQGISIVVFPQTTRMVEFDASQFNSIGVKLAKKAGVPVVPIALRTHAWSNGRLLKDFGNIHPERAVHFAFGAPLHIEGNGSVQQEQLVQHIQAHLKQWDAQDGKALTDVDV
jgi:1-acyl-sn-glycerol-3-phosphate acyltransferase